MATKLESGEAIGALWRGLLIDGECLINKERCDDLF
jgi:hypothetical protein